MSHPTTIPGWDGDLKQLAEAVEKMCYGCGAEFLHYLSAAFKERSVADLKAGKSQLAEMLGNVHQYLADASVALEQTWKFCEPFMKIKEGKEGD